MRIAVREPRSIYEKVTGADCPLLTDVDVPVVVSIVEKEPPPVPNTFEYFPATEIPKFSVDAGGVITSKIYVPAGRVMISVSGVAFALLDVAVHAAVYTVPIAPIFSHIFVSIFFRFSICPPPSCEGFERFG